MIAPAIVRDRYVRQVVVHLALAKKRSVWWKSERDIAQNPSTVKKAGLFARSIASLIGVMSHRYLGSGRDDESIFTKFRFITSSCRFKNHKNSDLTQRGGDLP